MADSGPLKVEQTQVAFFFSSPRQLDLEKVVLDQFGMSADSVEKKSGRPSTATLKMEQWLVTLNFQPTRLDVVVAPQNGGEPDFSGLDVVGTDDIAGITEKAKTVALQLLGAVIPIVRIGVVGQSAQAFRNQALAQARMQDQFPIEVRFPDNVKDLALQFNLPEKAGDGTELNVIHLWQLVKQQGFQISPSGFTLSESEVLRAMLDVNTPAPTPFRLPNSPAALELVEPIAAALIRDMVDIVRRKFEERAL